ncbi:Muconate cycloisomerase 1 [Fusarium circinatum]|uniref:Muconate cycloisomerase 1 n=1 Tax=Fusarium circinatum TaxID=48490 RepID=A0A8H5U178_FUSCI|nr:Muconate cycloisomerase 1 [Fusarium circinatum]
MPAIEFANSFGSSVHHLVSGSYTNKTLFLLALDTIAKTLTQNATVPGFGLHQFVTSNAAKDRVYATAMSEPPQLFSWSVDENYQFTHIDTVNITSSSCYFSDDGNLAFSSGGSTAAIHALTENGAIGDQIQELYMLPEEEIKNVNKTRAAVLYGAHAFDINVNRKGFVPHFNTVQMSRDGKYLFTSTRSWNNTEANGYVATFALNDDGLLKSEKAVAFYEAPVTLGSAGGLRVAPWQDETNCDPNGITDYMYLSDTSEGWLYILGWTPSNHTLDVVASLHYPDNSKPYEATWLD